MGKFNGKGAMWVELPLIWIAVVNVVAVPAIHLLISWVYTEMPLRWFNPASWWYRERRWECHGALYETVFLVRRWKALLPDGAAWFGGGFPKKSLQSRDQAYVREFRAETCRSEAAHLAQVIGIWLTVIWNPWPVAAIVMLVYGVLSNLPCIVVQRHTRIRMSEFLSDLEAKEPSP